MSFDYGKDTVLSIFKCPSKKRKKREKIYSIRHEVNSLLPRRQHLLCAIRTTKLSTLNKMFKHVAPFALWGQPDPMPSANKYHRPIKKEKKAKLRKKRTIFAPRRPSRRGEGWAREYLPKGEQTVFLRSAESWNRQVADICMGSGAQTSPSATENERKSRARQRPFGDIIFLFSSYSSSSSLLLLR